MTRPFLSIRNVSKHFHGVAAVENVSLDIAKGEFMTFLGPSGSGKSTTLYMVAGFFDPTGGDVLLDGKSILSLPSNKRNIGMVFQRYTLFPHLSVAENVAFPLRVRRRPAGEIARKVEEMLALVRLEKFASRMPAQLSGGQQQRVALARALAYDPPILLMDEPLSALDKKLREEIQTEIRRVHRETGVTILYVTHDQEEALRLSDRVALFNHGHIEQVGSARELYDQPRTRFTADFIGNSNFLPCKVTGHGEAGCQVAFPDDTQFAGLPMEDASVLRGDAVLMVRPDRIRISRCGTQTQSKPLTGRISDITFLGDTIHFVVGTGWGDEISVRTPLDAPMATDLAVGDAVALSWLASSARLFARA